MLDSPRSATPVGRGDLALIWAGAAGVLALLAWLWRPLLAITVHEELARVEGLSRAELARVDLVDWFNQLGLQRQLSPSRSNGMNAVLQRMRELTG